MSFTRKHYEETARIIRVERERAADLLHTPAEPDRSFWVGHSCALRNMQVNLTSMFAADNPRFDAERFAKACEPGSGK